MEILVYYHDMQVAMPKKVGVLYHQHVSGKDIFSFQFDIEWINSPICRMLDPDLQLYRGAQYVDPSKPTFGLFADSSPDRWGRVLLDRRESLTAHEQQRTVRVLSEADYLLGVFDHSRMGALRYKLTEDGPFLDADAQMSAPPFAAIRDLEYASWQFENDSDSLNSRWLKLLLAPGTSLGGARPKATVRDSDGNLWVAKFPSKNDRDDVGAWEAVAMILAKRCGIVVPVTMAQKYGNPYHTFLSRRFDRTPDGQRIHFASAMTMLGYSDGANAQTGVCYLQMAEWMMTYATQVEANLEQLWRRIVFNIAISNSDDHLRNHGFLLTKQGWILAPAYDLNPDEYASSLSLNITENNNTMDYALALEVAPYFGIQSNTAQSILNEIRQAVSSWPQIATQFHISREAQQRKARAFRV